MKPSTTAQILERIKNDYDEMVASGNKISMADLLNFGNFNIQRYCSQFKPHADAEQLKAIVKTFGEQYGVWLPNAQHHISCSLFLFPRGAFDRMVTMMENLTIDFYLNDMMGRDVFKLLSPAEQEQAKQLIERMAGVDEGLQSTTDLTPIEKANIALLKHFRDTATADWFNRFLSLFNYHIGVTHKDCNAASTGYIPDVEAYISLRCHYGGMHHIISWVEYSTGNFLNWHWLEKMNMAEELKQLHSAVAKFGALSNDLFSFEKEVIDNNTDANLLMVMALNSPGKSLQEIIDTAATLVRDFLKEFITGVNAIKARYDYFPCSQNHSVLQMHLADLETVMQACWMWQLHTRRYKRPLSVFNETVLEDIIA